MNSGLVSSNQIFRADLLDTAATSFPSTSVCSVILLGMGVSALILSDPATSYVGGFLGAGFVLRIILLL